MRALPLTFHETRQDVSVLGAGLACHPAAHLRGVIRIPATIWQYLGSSREKRRPSLLEDAAASLSEVSASSACLATASSAAVCRVSEPANRPNIIDVVSIQQPCYIIHTSGRLLSNLQQSPNPLNALQVQQPHQSAPQGSSSRLPHQSLGPHLA